MPCVYVCMTSSCSAHSQHPILICQLSDIIIMIFVDREFLKIFVVLVGNVSIKNSAPSKLYECVAGRWGRMSSNSGRMLELEILWSWSVTRLSRQTSSSWRPLTPTSSATLRRPTLTERQISNRESWCLGSWIACYLWCVSFSE